MKYELLYIVPSRYADTEIGEIQKKIGGLIEKAGGAVTREENLGKIRLAYPISQTRYGTYVLAYFDAETSVIEALDKQLRLTDEVLRHMLLQAEKGAEQATHRVETYIAPLSEEEGAPSSSPRPGGAARSSGSRPISIVAAPTVAAAPSVPILKDEKPLSMDELNKKLDAILDSSIGDNV
ncbi:30S ribosomal protein S6 [Candidatus Uhrbacteria bacterium]|nr:30S ribosomal protein S6 [Candidatus Uhrbacteria bacterium]